MSLDKFTEMYLDWVNNFLTVARFAEHYSISEEKALFIINTGRAIGGCKLEQVIY